MTTKMNPQVKEMWVNALRSGDYPQSIGQLQTRFGFCCLGVLCDLYISESHNHNVDWEDDYTFEGEFEFPPKSVVEWAGLSNHNPSVECHVDDDGEPYYENESLAEMNDNGISFNKIADLIESQL